MPRIIRKNLINKILFNQYSITFIGLLIIIMIAIPLGRNINKQIRLNKEINELERESEFLVEKNTSYRELIEFLQSNQFIEEQARANLNYQKEGENLVIIKDGQAPVLSDAIGYKIRGSELQPIIASNPQKWFHYFFNK